MIVAKLANHVDGVVLLLGKVPIDFMDAGVGGQPSIDVSHASEPLFHNVLVGAIAIVEDADDVVSVNGRAQDFIQLIHRLLVADEHDILLVALVGSDVHQICPNAEPLNEQQHHVGSNGIEEKGAGETCVGARNQRDERDEQQHHAACGEHAHKHFLALN